MPNDNLNSPAGTKLAANMPVPASIVEAVQKWTGHDVAHAVSLVGSEPVDAAFSVENTYTFKFETTLEKGSGKSTERTIFYGEEALSSHASADIAAMTGGLARTVSASITAPIEELFPKVSIDPILATGRPAASNIVCGTCGGTAQTICPTCSGSLQARCGAGCESGRLRCGTCHGSGQKSDPCYACGGAGGTYSQAPTWDWQKNQGQVGGQWQQCHQCYGKGQRQSPCTSCQYGYNTCSTCMGRGKVDCTTCHRTGKVTCLKCIGGYTHLLYRPKASVAHAHRLVPGDQESSVLPRILDSSTERLLSLAELGRNPSYAQSGTTVTRTLPGYLPLTKYSFKGETSEHVVLVSRKTGEVLDFGGLGEALLKASSRPPTDSNNSGPTKLANSLRTPVHITTVETMAFHVGLSGLIPGYRPSDATIDKVIGKKTNNFVGPSFVKDVVRDAAAAIRGVLLRSHGMMIALASALVAAGLVEKNLKLLPISSSTTYLSVVYSVAVCMVIGEALFILKLIRSFRAAGVSSISGLLGSVLIKSPLRWIALASYILLLSTFRFMQ